MIYTENFEKLPHGVYKIYWKGGGSSLASIGSTRNGKRWIAPCNWVNDTVTTDHWDSIKKVKLIKENKY